MGTSFSKQTLNPNHNNNNNNNNNNNCSDEVHINYNEGVEFGLSGNYPVGVQNLRLSNEVKQYLQEMEIFYCSEQVLQEKYQFAKCIDNPRLKNHIYYEGYFHSKKTEQQIQSINPRYGSEFGKLAAPKRLRAFYVAFRRRNKSFFEAIYEKMMQCSWQSKTINQIAEFYKVGDDTEEDEARFERILGDLAIQIHFGEEVTGKNLGWHCDAMNSMFHLALSIHGRRALHYKTSSTLKDDKNDESVKVMWQDEGDVYISCPSYFLHAVEYPTSTYETRTIAVQSRFLLSQSEMNDLYKLDQLNVNDDRFYTAVVANTLLDFPLLIPSLEDIQSVEAELNESNLFQ